LDAGVFRATGGITGRSGFVGGFPAFVEGPFSVVAASLTHPRTSARPVGAGNAAAVAASGGGDGKPVAELVSWLC
ncbi:hypothetical protein, partial [Bacillus subtilis]|uniref:hypothetical protein n=1 Tax=Bacillus subtilis TaxID=1423 RepID=UPI003C1C64B7